MNPSADSIDRQRSAMLNKGSQSASERIEKLAENIERFEAFHGPVTKPVKTRYLRLHAELRSLKYISNDPRIPELMKQVDTVWTRLLGENHA